ncbi:MAG TPA: hypothetical protein VGF24_20365 [Vicinamibacterales bacterium]
MSRAGLSCVILAAVIAVACESGESANLSPTAPTTTPPATTPTPSPANSCAATAVTGPARPQRYDARVQARNSCGSANPSNEIVFR